MRRTNLLFAMIVCLVAVSFVVPTVKAQRAEQAAKRILDATGVRGGVVIHIGCGDGCLTAALHASDSYIVQGLDNDAKNVKAARKHINSLGLYGKVSVDQLKGEQLPYIDNFVNLVVSEDTGEIPMAEILRVLAPKGVAYVKKAGQWI
ncbi:MAG: class I SAM-dependent methyltransferase, partial [Planctomycetota bacterium]|nr:class I SAM-dependent methyltransferase [Planctomycetota bacterium]